MAIITSVTSPAKLEDLINHLENESMTPIELILSGNKEFGAWAVDESCAIGEVAFFYCDESSIDTLARIYSEAVDADDLDVVAYVKRELMLHKCYAGSIVAVGRISSLPAKYEGTTWHASISNFHTLKNPIGANEFEDFATINRDSIITRLDEEQSAKLLATVMFGNLR